MCPGRFALQSAKTTRKGQFYVREKQQKHSRSLAKTMKRINQTNSNASETREPFGVKSSMVHKRKEDRRRQANGFDIPVTKAKRRCSLPESAGASEGGLFLRRLDQGLVGNAEHAFFFGQCCARCNNCGSHEVMLY